MYTVSFRGETHDFDDRMEAIEAAKEMTETGNRMAEIVDDSGREQMTYKGGALDHYVYETRPRR